MRFYHSLCLIEATEQGRSPIYAKISDYLSQGWGVIYAAEPDATQVVKQMARLDIDVEGYIESGALIIIDTGSLYSLQKTKFDSQELLNSWQDIIVKMKKNGFEKVLAVGAARPFFEPGDFGDRLAEYEQTIGKRFQTPLEAVCCYDSQTVDKFAPKQIIHALSSHECTLHDGWVYRQWDPDKIMQVISSGLDRSFGGSAAKLIFKTMRLIYKLDDGAILSKPELLEDAIRRLTRSSADSILNVLSNEFKQEMAWSPKIVAKG